VPLISAKFIIEFTNSAFDQAILMALVATIIYSIELIKILFIRKNNQIFRRGTVKNLQMTLGRTILDLDQKTLDSNSSGLFIQRLGSDTEQMSRIFTNGMVIIIKFLSAIGSFIAILCLDYHMFFFYLIASLILTGLYYIKNKKVNVKDEEYRKESDSTSGLASELVRGAKDIKMLNAKSSFMSSLRRRIDYLNDSFFEMRNIDITYNLFIGYIKLFFELLCVIYLIFLIKANVFAVAIGIALFNYRHTVLTNFMEIVSELLEECRNFNISSARVFSILSSKEFAKETFGTKSLKKVKGNFEFEHVNFSYTDHLILKDLSFKIKEGTRTAIVGKSGSGKTTIFNLIGKLYSVNEGKITIDGINIEDLDEDSIRGNITVISQNPYIFNMSIKDNLKLVRASATNKEIEEACHLACLDDLINTLPDKYDTVVGEGGVKLSGGERQRLAIARALIQKTKIILFDEATSALDNETQKKIQQAIDNLKDYTIIIIAHRLSTIVNCDNILILDDGHIIEEGRHDKLLKTSKTYAALCKTELSMKE
jgi:ABC-type multidrug transport system fused ATPase/permease subunit